jgi:L-ascorbate metabolism protein UlaG (beta-lactamase superfamily)
MISLTFVGTATTLLRMGTVTVLTDPNFLRKGQRAYLGKGLWSPRLTEPAMAPQDLPTLDAVLLSHLHGDHWDRVAKKSLDRTLPVFTTGEAAKALKRQGFSASVGLPTGSSEKLNRDGDTLTVTAMPGRHGRGPMRALLPPVMGSLLELDRPGRDPFRVYVTGDTLLVREIKPALRALPPLDAVVIHTGGTRVMGMLVTLDDKEGCDFLELLDYRQAVPIHYDDYGVFKTPLQAFLDRARQRGLADRVRPVHRGETLDLEG